MTQLVTILFADVVGSTRLGQYLEPDHILEIKDTGLKRLASPIEAHGGHVARFMGDGFKAVFGTPVAHEDDPERATRAGLEIIAAARVYARELQARWALDLFQIRVGVNTSVVAIGGQTKAGDTLMGMTVNLAARLESAAPPDGLLISLETYQHVKGMVEVEARSPIHAKVFEEQVPVFLVRGIAEHPGRRRGLETYGIFSPLIGKDEEYQVLTGGLERLLDGRGGVIAIIAEAGLGKSRRVSEARRSIANNHCLWLEAGTRMDGHTISYWPFQQILRQYTGISEDDDEQNAWEKLEERVSVLRKVNSTLA